MKSLAGTAHEVHILVPEHTVLGLVQYSVQYIPVQPTYNVASTHCGMLILITTLDTTYVVYAYAKMPCWHEARV